MPTPHTTPADTDRNHAEAIAAIRTLVETRDLRQAKTQLRQLQSRIDDQTWLMITEIANTLRFKTHQAALAKLRNLWLKNQPYRPLIEACAPKTDGHQHIPQPRQDTKPHPRETPPLPGNLIEAYEDELTTTERDDPGTERPELIVDRHDYDLDATYRVTTSLCVSCRLERAIIDLHTDRYHSGHGDDGLCEECRILNRPGIPELPIGHTQIDAIQARLNFLTEHFNTTAPGLFRQEWHHADRETRNIITGWAQAHLDTEPPRTVPVTKTVELNGECEKCGDWRQLRDRLCIDCHPEFDGEATPAGSIAPQHRSSGDARQSARSELPLPATRGRTDGSTSDTTASVPSSPSTTTDGRARGAAIGQRTSTNPNQRRRRVRRQTSPGGSMARL